MRGIVAMLLVVGCGGPVLQNAPRPDPAVVAGAAAALAGAATLADPAGAAKRQEENKPYTEKREQNVKTTVPKDVFDRLDDDKAKPKTGAKPGAKPALQPAAPDQPLPPMEPTDPADGTPLP